MKKSMLLMLSAISVVLLFAGCAGKEVPFAAKSYTESAQKVQKIVVDVRDRRIEASASEDDNIHIDYYESEKEFYNLSLSDGCLTMTAATDKEWGDYIGGKTDPGNRIIRLRLPKTLLSSLVLSTTNEDMTLSELTLSDSVSLSANGGTITFEQLQVGKALTLNVKNGNITGSVVGSYEEFAIACDTKKGACNLPERKEQGDKTLSVKANNGDVNITFDPEK